MLRVLPLAPLLWETGEGGLQGRAVGSGTVLRLCDTLGEGKREAQESLWEPGCFLRLGAEHRQGLGHREMLETLVTF